jgi:hypothetical protein
LAFGHLADSVEQFVPREMEQTIYDRLGPSDADRDEIESPALS